MLGYLSAMYMLEAIHKGGGASGAYNPEKTREALRSLDTVSPLGRVAFDDKGEPKHFVATLFQTQKGNQVVIYPTDIDEFSLPLPDAAVDRILLVHALEMSDDPEGLLREVWRVLAPSGRVMAVIPNRRGVWTRTDATPFGHGRPYSRSQITQLLRQTWFTPTAWGEALFVPPVAGGWFLRSAMAWERIGAALSLPFAGVHIVEATKQVYRAIPAHRERTRLIPALPPVLVPSSLQRSSLRDPGVRRDP